MKLEDFECPCVMCGKLINPGKEDYKVGPSLGEYWCIACYSDSGR